MKHDDPNVSDEERTARVKAARTNMAILHFLFNGPKWSFSLFIFLATRSVRLVTPQYGIEMPLRHLQVVVDAESDSYKSCAVDAFARLQEDLKETANQEFHRVNQLQESNKALIQKAQEREKVCLASTESARGLLIQWLDDNRELSPQIMTEDTEVCSEEDRKKVWSILGGSVRTVENEVSFAFDGFFAANKRSLGKIGSFASRRFEYDFNYFITDRIHPAVQLLEGGNFNASGLLFSLDNEALELEIRQSFVQVEDILNDASEQMQAMTARIEALSTTIEDFYFAYVTLYTRFVEGAAFVQDILPPGAPVPDVLDVSSIPVAASLLPTSGYNPRGDLGSIEMVLENSTQACINVLHTTINELTRQSSRNLRASYHDLSASLANILDFQDYDPPVFEGSNVNVTSISEEVEILNQLGRDAREATERSLGKLKLDNNFELTTEFEEPTNQPGNSLLADDSSTFAYLQARFPSFSLPYVMVVLVTWVYGNAWILEVIVQVIRLWRLEAIYSQGAIPNLPEIDFGDGDNEDSEAPTTTTVVLKTVLNTLAAPRCLLLILLSPLFIFVGTVWQPYIESSCADSGEGTFLATHFLAPLLINEASLPGNALFLKGELQCHQSRREICNRMEAQLNPLHQIDVESIRAIEQTTGQAEGVLQLLRSCIDDGTMDQINESCCGLKDHGSDCASQETKSVCPIDYSVWPAAPFHPFEKITSKTVCSNEAISIQQARFECTSLLEACDAAPCAGVNADFLTSEIVKSDCAVEQYILDCCLLLLVILYHAVVVNIICSLFFNGIRQVFWRKICVSGFKIRTRVREDGSLARGGEQLERANKVAIAIRRLKLSGIVQLLFGGLVLILWCVSIYTLAI